MPHYSLEDGVRSVTPYYHEYRTPFKNRWAGKTTTDILTLELGQSPAVVEHALATGKVHISTNNGKAGGGEILKREDAACRLLQPHDIIHNLQHVHEPSVLWPSGSLTIYEDDDILVVNKPPGVSTHPGGIYRYNSVVEVLQHEKKLHLWPCHRLDKATLGILVLAKSKETCHKYMALFANKTSTSKRYLARVTGKFPLLCRLVCPVFEVNTCGGYINVPNAKEVPGDSATEFERVSYSEKLHQSIVMCQPISGKMHQIRIHLRNLGFPIANDPLYLPEDSVNVKRNDIETEIYRNIFEKYPRGDLGTWSGPSHIDITSFTLEEILQKMAQLVSERNERETSVNSVCSECKRPLHIQTLDPGIWLHAVQLASNEIAVFDYKTDYPIWSAITTE